MAGIFPNGGPPPIPNDGGIPPNPDDRNNPAQAYLPVIAPADTNALYYGANGCEVRLRPHVLNSLISEVAAIADRAEMPYRAANLTNLELATRYIVQRGIPRGAFMVQQNPWHFDVELDPVATRYNDFMTLSLIPKMTNGVQYETFNEGYVRINVNGLGYVPLLQADGTELEPDDICHEVPFIAVCFDCKFYRLGQRGKQGIQGIQGEQGPQGIQGPQGSSGLFGEVGSITVFISWMSSSYVGRVPLGAHVGTGQHGDWGAAAVLPATWRLNCGACNCQEVQVWSPGRACPVPPWSLPLAGTWQVLWEFAIGSGMNMTSAMYLIQRIA